jgi:ribonuclease P protein component
MPARPDSTTETPASRTPGEPRVATFRARHRLSGGAAFRAVNDARVRKHRGPLTCFAIPNDLGEPRLGMSVGRRVGSAVRRNAIKRRLRDAFRHAAREVDFPARPDAERPGGFDLVIHVRPHEPLPAGEYRALLLAAMRALAKEWAKRLEGEAEADADRRGRP